LLGRGKVRDGNIQKRARVYGKNWCRRTWIGQKGKKVQGKRWPSSRCSKKKSTEKYPSKSKSAIGEPAWADHTLSSRLGRGGKCITDSLRGFVERGGEQSIRERKGQRRGWLVWGNPKLLITKSSLIHLNRRE